VDKIVIVDDDADIRRIAELRLRIAGFNVLTAEDGEAGLRLVQAEKPKAVLLDLMMPKMHGFAVCQAIRSDPSLQGTFIIVASAKTFTADIKKAKELGADLYVIKPYDLEVLVKTIQTALASTSAAIAVKFWGTRGSIPTPGRTTLRYGGNTPCVEVRCGETVMLLDCGTGAREAGLALAGEFKGKTLRAHVFVSHTHWDHIQGFPFFAPAYVPGNHLRLYSVRGADKSLSRIFTGQMDSSYFPVDLGNMMAHLDFVELEGPIELGSAKITHFYLNHPGLAVGFRIESEGKTVVYITDHEPYCRLSGDNDHNRKLDSKVDEFARGADLYIREAQYTEEEYAEKRGWGHSTWKDAVDSAHAAQAKRLVLFHHDPLHDDDFLDRVVASCRDYMHEQGMTFECSAGADYRKVSI
jgi:phosphoribosyl 1,2-cyclic phosphodiesterase